MSVDYKARIKTLNKKYTNADIAKKLNISLRTLYNYKSGKTTPTNKKTKTKINNMYRYERDNEIKLRYTTLTNYMLKSNVREFDDFIGYENYMDRLDEGYNMVAYVGTKNHIPIEVKLSLGKENINDYATHLHIIGAVTRNYEGSFTDDRQDKSYLDFIHFIPVYVPLLNKYKFKTASYEERHNILRKFFFEVSQSSYDKSSPTAYLGYYFDDEYLNN